MEPRVAERGLLPAPDPAQSLDLASPLHVIDDVGRDLPGLLEDAGFRSFVRRLHIPEWPEHRVHKETLSQLRLYYVRLGFLALAYVNQVGQPKATVLPRSLAVPLSKACALLGRPPILSYDGYVLYNWKRLDPAGSIALGNLDTIQNFVQLNDEHWFILVHVEIEAVAGGLFAAMHRAGRGLEQQDTHAVSDALHDMSDAVRRQVAVRRRIPEGMDPALYHRTFRPYIRFFENVVYEGVTDEPMNFRGETGAQSTIIPALVAFLKIRHRRSALTDHLTDMRRFMPSSDRALIATLEDMPSIRPLADPRAYNDLLEALAERRETHYRWGQEYIDSWVDDPRGTGGTPYMAWLRQLVDETRAHKLPV